MHKLVAAPAVLMLLVAQAFLPPADAKPAAPLPAGAYPAPAAPPVPAAQSETVVSGELGATLDRYLRGLESFGYAGAAVVGKDGEIVLQKGFGLADPDSGREVTPATVFTTGSITKQFTGAAVLKLEMAGALSVDDKITDYFDDVPADKQDMTIHHLLTHTAGFPGAIGDDFGIDTRESFLAEALNTALLFEPGERHEYSNVGYSLAAIIVELVSGKTYEHFLRDELFLPAGMTRTGYAIPLYEPEEVAVGYRRGRRWGTFLERPTFFEGPSWNLKGNGGIQSTVGDMYRWHVALEGDEILSPEAKEKFFARYVDEGFGDSWYGYGWSIMDTPRGTTRIAHNGGNGIFSADFHRYVDEGVVVYVTSASSEFFIDPISRDLAAIVFGEPVEMPPLVLDWEQEGVDPAVLDEYAGTYVLDMAAAGASSAAASSAGGAPTSGGDAPSPAAIRVRRDGDHLRVAASGSAARNLLLGGTGGLTDPGVAALTERSQQIIDQWIDGDAGPIHQAMDTERTLQDLSDSLANVRRMREEQYGPLQSATIGNVLPDGDGHRAFVGLQHADGRAWMVFHWDADSRLAAIELVRDLPQPVSTVYPTSPSAFTSYDVGSPTRVTLRFERPDGGDPVLIFSTATGDVRLQREG